MRVTLNKVYVHKLTGHRLMPYHFDRRAGIINERLHAHNLTTGYDETWSTRLFLAEHDKES